MVNFSFTIDESVVEFFSKISPKFGFNGLGEVVFYRTYSRKDNPKKLGQLEDWVDVVERVVNGMFSIQKDYCLKNNINWNEEKAQQRAIRVFEMIFNFKFSPPGRGLWSLGSEFVHERKVPEALQNCAFISTQDIANKKGDIFAWLMEKSMLGVGVGFDTRGASTCMVYPVKESTHIHNISDDREGWAESVKLLIDSFLTENSENIDFNYSNIRPKGEDIKGFGGKASGPDVLKELHNRLKIILQKNVGRVISSRTITDICNAIAICVVAGNVRRSALIALGNVADKEFAELKNYELNPDRIDIGWSSNNSMIIEESNKQEFLDNLDFFIEKNLANGEPGFLFLDNSKNFGRMNGIYNVDEGAIGANPCFTGNQLLLTSEGYKSFEELCDKENIVLIGEDGKEYNGKVWYTGEKDVISLYYDPFRPKVFIQCTPDHKIKTIDGDFILAKESLFRRLKTNNNSNIIVTKIEHIGKHVVYDFTIDNEQHTGIVNNVVVHNCMEQSLHDKEMCTLSEIFLPNIKTKEEFFEVIKYAFLYGKTVTLFSDYIEDDTTRNIMIKNRRIGLSLTGITQFIAKHGVATLVDWLDHGYAKVQYYDQLYSQWLGVNKSVRTTTVKPSGTISLLAGVTPGVHYSPGGRFYIRRMTLAKDSELVEPLKTAGYPVLDSVYSTDTYVVEFPVDSGVGVIHENNVSPEKQLALVKLVQKYWSDNAVSVTVKVDPKTMTNERFKSLLLDASEHTKGVSFLPITDGVYAQAPYEEITEEEYEDRIRMISPLHITSLSIADKQRDAFCDGQSCQIVS